jgi:hypothetical protein
MSEKRDTALVGLLIKVGMMRVDGETITGALIAIPIDALRCSALRLYDQVVVQMAGPAAADPKRVVDQTDANMHIGVAQDWLKQHLSEFLGPRNEWDTAQVDSYHAQLGLLVNFVTDCWPSRDLVEPK